MLDVTKWFGETSGGVRTYLHEKSAYVARHPDLRHVLAIPGAADQITDGDGVRTYRLRGPRIPTQQQYRFLLATRSLRQIVEHERPDVIEVGSQIFVPWVARLATRRRPTPLVGFYHGNVEREVGASLQLGERANNLSRALTRSYLRAVDSLFTARFAASESLADDLRAAGIRDVTRVRLGVDTVTFHPSRRHRAADTRRERGIPVDEPVAVYCGRIAPEKDIAWLVRAWPRLADVTPAWLVVIGDGPMLPQLKAECARTGARVLWQPFEQNRERLADLLASADFAMSPGPIETFGLSALEAMACGTPVISVNCGAGAELVRRSRGGAVYGVRDWQDLVHAVGEFLRQDTRSFGARGRDYAVREHGWNYAFEELFAVYERLAGRTEGRRPKAEWRPT